MQGQNMDNCSDPLSGLVYHTILPCISKNYINVFFIKYISTSVLFQSLLKGSFACD